MRLHRFFIDGIAPTPDILVSDREVLHQWKSVFRLKKDDEVILLDGGGISYHARIETLASDHAICTILEKLEAPKNKNISLTIVASIIKKDKFEWMLEKVTEIGVDRVVPVLSSRTEKKDINIERARKIVREASEQSGRFFVPQIEEPTTLASAIEVYKEEQCFALDGKGEKFNREQLTKKEITFFVGPEGGWTDEELALFVSKNIPLVSIGENTLRAETASVALSSLVLLSN